MTFMRTRKTKKKENRDRYGEPFILSEGTAISRCGVLGLNWSSVSGPEGVKLPRHGHEPTALQMKQRAQVLVLPDGHPMGAL